MNKSSSWPVVGGCVFLAACAVATSAAPMTLTLDEQRIVVRVDTENCRWSAERKGTQLRLDNVHFLEGDSPLGWAVTAKVNRHDEGPLGSFETVTLHGTQKGRLDFDYHISASKTGNDIIVRLDRANHTGAPVEIDDVDYMVADDVRLGGTIDKWLTFGTKSVFNQYYGLTLVRDLPRITRGVGAQHHTNLLPGTPYLEKMYEVCQLVRNVDTGQCILMGHLTVNKGHSRFEVARKDASDSMRMKAYCGYYVTMPDGKSFTGEKLLVHLGSDGLRALEHLGELIGLANNVRLKEKRPLDLEDRALVSLTHCRWMRWASGGTEEDAATFIKRHGLDKFYYGVSGVDHFDGPGTNPEYGTTSYWGLYDAASGGKGGHSPGTQYPAECYLPLKVLWGSGRVLDFSNPLSAEMERKRIAETFAGKEDKVNWGHLDFSEVWDKWTGQRDPFMSAVQTWHAGAAPWCDFVDTKAPRMRNRSCMTKLDFNYGYVDLARISEDSDGTRVPGTYEGKRAFLGECALGAAARFFYNTRVFWNDGDNFHVYRYAPPVPSAPPTEPRRIVPYNEAKVMANYKAIATSCVMPSDAFDTEYPEDRIELLKRVAPPTADAAYPVDLFVRKPAAVWNMPVERPFGQWSVLAVFNFGPGMHGADFRVTLDAEKDLRLDPAKEYVAYEFWSRKLVGTFKGKFTSRAIRGKDCDIYSIVEKQDRPVLLSTSRHVRQMAFDVRRLAWDAGQNRMSGVSRAVGGDPYQLRVYVPAGYRFDRVELPSNLSAKPVVERNLLTVDYTTSTDDDVAWNIYFSRVRQ